MNPGYYNIIVITMMENQQKKDAFLVRIFWKNHIGVIRGKPQSQWILANEQGGVYKRFNYGHELIYPSPETGWRWKKHYWCQARKCPKASGFSQMNKEEYIRGSITEHQLIYPSPETGMVMENHISVMRRGSTPKPVDSRK